MAKSYKIIILNGPNLNMLGLREPEIYGAQTLDEIKALCIDDGTKYGANIDFRQSNHEGELVEWIQNVTHHNNASSETDKKLDKVGALIINAAAYTHTSVAIHDALKMLDIPIIEVHLSDPQTREDFRHHSYVEPLAHKIIKGHGAKGYRMAIQYVCENIL